MTLKQLKYTTYYVSSQAYQTGRIVVVHVAGYLDKSVAAWDTLTIGSGLPHSIQWMGTPVMSQDINDPRAVVSVNEDGALQIESKSAAIPGGWVFANLVYITYM